MPAAAPWSPVLALLPLHGKGVTGNALAPSYGNFGWFAYEPA